MELLQELLITVGVSLLVSFVIAKLFSMASPPCDAVKDNSASVYVTSAIEETGFREEKSVVWDAESERRRVRFVGEKAVKESGAEYDEIVCSEEVWEEVVGVGLKNRALEEISFVEERVMIGGDEVEQNLFDERSDRDEVREIPIESGISEDIRVWESEAEKGNGTNESDGGERNGGEGEEEGLFDDWEGIERTELEKVFGAAVVFVGSKSNAERVSGLDSDTKMRLFGLHKVAIEGPCCVPSPMALKVSARAKWNAWQQLGDMSQEVAMEQYISLLSRSIPGWMGDDAKDGKQVFSDVGSSTILPFSLHKQQDTENESVSEELKPCDEECGMIGIVQTP
ncbi:Acyl-CoA-binding domain-containing protein [Actinidia chinensis var. chinensis]|uniref:Acyl-CoA-binding domain-containing protein n=1 Tax=Actinidia chinensis var. chinensis TaxID=1590841 RepID=A0A2R6S181_ACTCC|nr:Acyl-CoA-binding domain-containing protein [Actinidia chinensis var. chinensis]